MPINVNPAAPALRGLWMAPDGRAHVLRSVPGQGDVAAEEAFSPFLWRREPGEGSPEGLHAVQELEGAGPYRFLLEFATPEALREAQRERYQVEVVRPLEHQYLLARQERMYGNLAFAALRRCQMDIETACAREGGFSNPREPGDRVLAIGLRLNAEVTFLELREDSDEAERELLLAFNAWLRQHDPDTIEGHNLFKFDLDYLRHRAKRLRVPCLWGRFGQEATFRNSRLRVAERWMDYPRCDIPGRDIVDTFFLVMFYDIATRDMPSYSLKEAALYLGLTQQGQGRTYVAGGDIARVFHEDRPRFLAYLGDDLRETAGIADLLLPTYFAQIKSIPMLLQEAVLRGAGAKVDLLFLDRYYRARCALPEPPKVASFEGAYTRSFASGVFREVLHFDVASLYPSLLMLIGRNPQGDSLGVFMPLLKELREYRLKYKKLAREANDAALQREFSARQASFKILINSFYGYLGFEGARFADSALAAEVTRRGRELLQQIIEVCEALGCKPLEADTDGIYLHAPQYYEQPDALLEQIATHLPEGIELEFAGRYVSMFCYKAKNYALYDGKRVHIHGSALRSRGIEPFLKELSDALVAWLLGAGTRDPRELASTLREALRQHRLPVEQLAKREFLSQNPEKYRETIQKTGKGRRAALEAALLMHPSVRMGDQVAYYLIRGERKRLPDWQLARPVEMFDPHLMPYDPEPYLAKIDDWLQRYAEFLPGTTAPGQQRELF